MTCFTTLSLDSVSVCFSSRCSRPLLPVEWSWFMSGNPFPELKTLSDLDIPEFSDGDFRQGSSHSSFPLAVFLACFSSSAPWPQGYLSQMVLHRHKSILLHMPAPFRKRHRNYSGHTPLPPLIMRSLGGCLHH